MTTATPTGQAAEDICERVADGASLAEICADPAMPSRATVQGWLLNDEGFRRMYAVACDERTDLIGSQMIRLADGPHDADTPARIEALKAAHADLSREEGLAAGDAG
jgi:hypothetical protein